MSDQKKTILATESIDAVEDIMGRFPGCRRVHARGAGYQAVFTPNGRASKWTTAPHLQTEPVQAIVRFSHASPDPHMADALSPVKGMAVQFQLPDGQVTNLVGATVPVFIAKRPEVFVEMMDIFRSAKHGIPRLRALAKLFIKYPESRSVFKVMKKFHAPASFATGRYYSINAFYFINETGKRQAVKYQWEPEDTSDIHSKKKTEAFPTGYLEEELNERLSKGSVRFRLTVQLAAEEDPVDDPTKQWPKERETITVGHLEVTNKLAGATDPVIFDPTVLTDGIACTEDPILHFRSEAYKVSHERRMRQE